MVFFAMAQWPAPPSGGHEPMTLPIRSVTIASAANPGTAQPGASDPVGVQCLST